MESKLETPEDRVEGFPKKEIESQLRAALAINKGDLWAAATQIAQEHARRGSGENYETAIKRAHAILKLGSMHSAAKRRADSERNLHLKAAKEIAVTDEDESELGKMVREYQELLDPMDHYEALDTVLNNRNIIDTDPTRGRWETLLVGRIAQTEKALKKYGQQKREERKKHPGHPEMVEMSTRGQDPYPRSAPGPEPKRVIVTEKPPKWEQPDLI